MGLFDIFKKKETDETLAKTATERWIVGTYAMWSEYADGDWHYFAGSVKKSNQEGASMRVMLRRDWLINNKKELLESLSELSAVFKLTDSLSDGAWDLCRACQILGMGFVGGYITREEMIEESIKVGKQMQSKYHSWQELYDNYIKGYKDWRLREGGDDAQKEISERENLCYRLRTDPQGPCAVPWDLELTAEN